jgi:hypothetical protein
MNLAFSAPGTVTICGVSFLGPHIDGQERMKSGRSKVLTSGNLYELKWDDFGTPSAKKVRTTPGYSQKTKITHRIFGIDRSTGQEFFMEGVLTCFTPSRYGKAQIRRAISNRVLGNNDKAFLCCDCEICREVERLSPSLARQLFV